MKKNSLFLRVFYFNLTFFLLNTFLFLTFPSFDIFFSGLFFIDGQFLDHHFQIIKTIRSILKEILVFIENTFFVTIYILFGSLFFSKFYSENFTLYINGSGGFVGNYLSKNFFVNLLNRYEDFSYYLLSYSPFSFSF